MSVLLAAAAEGASAMEHRVMGNTPVHWLLALGICLAAFFLLKVVKRILVRRLSAFARTTETVVDDYVAELLAATKSMTLVVFSFYAGIQVLEVPPLGWQWIRTATIIVALAQMGFWADAALRSWLSRYQASVQEDPGRVTTLRATTFVVRLALFSVVALVALDNIPGVHVTTLITSMGIGGVAIALATQNILADLFASLIISLDQPFIMGDFIVVDDKMGTVETIGLKTTRVRSLTGEQLIFSNTDLLKSRIRNYKRMAERRVLFSLGVTYQTTSDKLRAIPAMIRQAVETQPSVRFERAHFKEFGPSSLNLEVVYWVTVPDYNVFMDVQQAINLALFDRFAQEGIEFAYPTQTVFLEKSAS